MKRLFRHFYLRLKQRSGEHEQAMIRLFITPALFMYLWLVNGQNSQSEIFVVLAFALYSVLLGSHILFSPAENVWRIRLSILADISATSVSMMLANESGIIFYGIYLWVIVGNGMRYGVPALMLSYVCSLIWFIYVATNSPYWISNPRLAEGLFAILLLIPLYILKLRNQLNKALDSAKEANQAKSQFLAHMSHEMRTPLNGLIGASDLLTATPLNSEQYDLVKTLKNSSKILRQLIENVLDFSKIESGKLESEKIDFDLHELVNNIIDMFQPQAEDKKLHLSVRFTPDTAFALHGDALHLLQIIVNLVGNAIKFTNKGSVELRISTVQQDASRTHIRFEVIDTGIGIPAESQHTIFEHFTQANSSIARQYGGSGLGTTISRDLVRLLDGQIGMSSELGIGSVFWFELPFTKQITTAESVVPTSLEQLRVISIGIAQAERKALANHLAGWRVRYEYEESVERFFSRLSLIQVSQQRGVVVMCSPQNCGMTPKEFAEKVTAMNPNGSISLILFAADAGDDSLGLGYSCSLHFPLDKTLLFNALHGVMTPRPTSGVISFKDHYERSNKEKRGVRILVADDNGTNRKIIARILEHGGHKVELVEDGEQALDKLEQKRFDLMILDMNMPQMGGLEVVRLHRAMSTHTSSTPVIILTADATIAAMQECEAAEIDSYLTKPVDAITLLDTIARLTATVNTADVSELSPAIDEDTDQSSFLNENTLHQLALLGEGQDNFLQVVIHGYISETEKILETMRTALSNQEYATLKELAHIIKGSSGNVGADAMHDLCSEIMQSNPTELDLKANTLLKQTQACFKSTRMLLIQHLGQYSRASL
ncbi:MAG: ATP-binding protein [Sideroxydans sp.]|jgi:two-component system sensor histidine kinase RpfC